MLLGGRSTACGEGSRALGTLISGCARLTLDNPLFTARNSPTSTTSSPCELRSKPCAPPPSYEKHLAPRPARSSFELPKDRDRLLEYAAQYTKAAAAARAKRKKGQSTLRVLKEGRCCTPGREQQPQPQPNAGDRLAFICKPDASSQGRGIYLAMGLDEIDELQRPGASSSASGGGGADSDESDSSDDDSSPDATPSAVRKRTMIQAYLPRPLTMDGRKFDLRCVRRGTVRSLVRLVSRRSRPPARLRSIYVLVTSAFPTLRAYIYRQGLVRLATVQYEPPTSSNASKRRSEAPPAAPLPPSPHRSHCPASASPPRSVPYKLRREQGRKQGHGRQGRRGLGRRGLRRICCNACPLCG